MSKSERAWRRSVEIALFGYFMALLIGITIGHVWPTIAIAGALLLAGYLWAFVACCCCWYRDG
ncbi:MAG: hypothetical protein R3F12_12020 [Lysobacteraceae bacterium]